LLINCLIFAAAAADVDVLCLASWREAANTYALWRMSGPGLAELDGGYRCAVSCSLLPRLLYLTGCFATSVSETLLLCPHMRAEYCDQFVCLCDCLSASISLEPLDRSSRNLWCRSPVVVSRSSSAGGVTIRYVLPVLWMTSRLAVTGRMAVRERH